MESARVLLLLPCACALVLAGCGAEAPPARVASVTIAASTAAEPAPESPFFLVPRAEASPVPPAAREYPDVKHLRSEGRRHALERTRDGVVVQSEERGVLGLLPDPDAVIWAGFVEDDAVLVLTKAALRRAATPEDALAGKLETLEKLDAAATVVASAGALVVAAVPAAGGAFYESHDGGRHFTSAARPAKGVIVDLAARSDGVVVAAIEAPPDARDDARRHRADVYVRRAKGPWARGPSAGSYGQILDVSGDGIFASVRQKPGDFDWRGLDAAARWIRASSGSVWPGAAWTGTHVAIDVPVARPGMPKPSSTEGSFGMLGMLSGREGSECKGVECLALARPPNRPGVAAFPDGRCRAEHVIKKRESVPVIDERGRSHEETTTTLDCDPSAPATRGSALLLPGPHPRIARLPRSCANGEIAGTARASFVVCTAKHQGAPALLAVADDGTLAVGATLPGPVTFEGAESASDGTTLLFTADGAWLCAGLARDACAPIPGAGFLTARVLPGGRALVARRGTGARELDLEVWREPGAAVVHVPARDHMIALETTEAGTVRIWTSAKRESFGTPESFAKEANPPVVESWLVAADGKLVLDPEGRDNLEVAIEAARKRR